MQDDHRPPARQRILDAAARLLRERGLARLTTRQIAEAADAAEGSITKNFGGKIGLLIELLSQELPELRARQEAATPPGQRPMRTVLVDLMERGVDYYAAALPMIAGAAADQELSAAYRNADRQRGTGPQQPSSSSPTTSRNARTRASCREVCSPPRSPWSCGGERSSRRTPNTSSARTPSTAIGPDEITAVADMLLAGGSSERARDA